MITVGALVALCVGFFLAYGYGSTVIAEQGKLQRAYDPKYFPLVKNLYLFGWVACAVGAAACIVLLNGVKL